MRCVFKNNNTNTNKMGVDYSGNYGIGVKIIDIDFEDIEDIDCIDEYMELLEDTDVVDLYYFETGSENYGGDSNEFYLCVSKPFEDGMESFISKVNLFKKYLKDNNIEYEGDIDCVGGLNIY